MANNETLLDQRKSGPRLDLAQAAYRARRAGRPFLRQVADIARLHRAPNRLGPREYYLFRLYDPARSDADRQAYIGEIGQAGLFFRLTDPTWVAAAHDKLLYYAAMAGLGCRVPRVLGVLHATRRFPGAEALPDARAAAAFLRRAPYPMFGKPVTGRYSLGTVALAGYDAAGDRVRGADGKEAGLDAFVAELGAFAAGGYLFQERLRPHPFVREACGDRIATVRLAILCGRNGPDMFYAVWKVPAGAHVADNFWRPGNLLAALDRHGRIVRVVQGAGPAQREVETHPDTGFRLLGATLPDWAATVELTLGAATAFPGLRAQAWDVALTDQGPLLLELNVGGDVNLPQYAFGRGVYREGLKALDEEARARRSGTHAA